jgi:hypothetical protein
MCLVFCAAEKFYQKQKRVAQLSELDTKWNYVNDYHLNFKV